MRLRQTSRRPTNGQLPSVERLIGGRIRQARLALGMTLEQLAGGTGFTKSYLSKIENSEKVPPIGSLARIAQALGTEMLSFLESPGGNVDDNRVSVVRVNERHRVLRGGSAFGYDYQSLAHKRRHKHMEPFVFTFPSKTSKPVFFEHVGEEFIFILSGRVEFEAAGTKWILESGDSVYFDSSFPHKGKSLAGDAKALVIIYAPETNTKP